MFPPEKRTCSLKRNYLSRKCIFQALIFRATFVSFPGSFPWESQCPSVRAHLCITSSQWISRYSWSFRRARTSCWLIRSRTKDQRGAKIPKQYEHWSFKIIWNLSYHYTNYMNTCVKIRKYNLCDILTILYDTYMTLYDLYLCITYLNKYHLNSFNMIIWF